MRCSRTAPACPLALGLLFALLPAAALAQGGSYTVTALDDSGPGTLRAAIELANADSGPSTIGFDPDLAGGTIPLASPLPDLWENGTTIDGDLDGDCQPDIRIDGDALANGGMLYVRSAENLIRGLAFTRFPPCGLGGSLWLQGTATSGNALECNWIGLDLAGTALPRHCYGVKLVEGAHDNRIGPGNRITAGEADGVFVDDGNNNAYPEFAGLTPDLVQVVHPIDLVDDCAFFRIRGGATLYDSGGHPFTENIGLRLTGRIQIAEEGDYTFSLPNLDDQGRLFVLDETLIDWPGGGTPPPAVKHLAAGDHAIRLDYFEGGGAATLRLEVTGPQSTALTTSGNTGGCASGQVGLCGQFYQLRVPTERNRITRNSIWSNSGSGISLGWGCGPQVDDPDDLDLGPNTLLNTPVLTGVSWAQIPGSPDAFNVSGTAPPGATVEIFVGEGMPDSHGEGKVYLGDGVADGNGDFVFPVEIPLGLTAPRLTATATDALGNTSEFALNFEWEGGHDVVTVASGASGLPDTVVEIPIHVRDLSHSPLGVDRPAGERIQGFAIKVAWNPAGAVGYSDFARAGITAALTPSYETVVRSGNTASYVLHFDETTDPVPFVLDAAAPGDPVAKLLLTLAPHAPAGLVTLTLDPVTALANQAGTIEETVGLGTLVLVSGGLEVESNAVRDLLAWPLSASEIHLGWNDPNAGETGFRVERSPDGASWAPIGAVGPDDLEFLDSGLAPATLYFYRLVTLLASGDGHPSPAVATSTHAATAAHVCARELSGPRTAIGQTAIARGPGEWAVVWADQVDGRQSDLFFQRLASGDLSALGGSVQVTATDAVSSVPVLLWNGAHYGLFWREELRGAPGPEALQNRHFFALLNPDGTKVRGDVPLPAAPGWSPFNMEHAFGWDGTHWGLFFAEWTTYPYVKLVYYRLDEDGDLALGPLDVVTPPDSWAGQAVAWAPGPGLWGLAWHESPNWYGESEMRFQRVEASTGLPVGPVVSLGTFTGPDQGVAAAWDPSAPPEGAWVVAWSQYAMDGTDAPVMLRRIAADGTVLGSAPTRLSDDFDPVDGVYDLLPTLAVTDSGEIRAFAMSFDPESGAEEVGMLRADGEGNRLGSRVFLTPPDGWRIDRPHVANEGSEQAVVFRDSTHGTMEVSAVAVDAVGAAGAQVWVTAGHSRAGAAGIPPGGLAPLGSGFVALWSDHPTSDPNSPPQFYGQIVDGTGGTVASLTPLAASPSLGLPALVTVGGEFAVAWRPATGGIAFARFDGMGNPIVGEVQVATVGMQPTAVGFDGERYGVVFRRGAPDAWWFVPVWPDGTVAGTERSLFAPTAGQTPVLLWVGNGWALVWRGSDSLLYYGLFDRDGDILVPPLPLTGPRMNSARSEFSAAFNGGRILVAWSDHPGADPPATDIYFTLLELDGTVVTAPTIAIGTVARESRPLIVWRDDTFHLFYAGGIAQWVHEVEIQSDGTLVPGERHWTNRGAPAAVASNGAVTALVWGQGELYLMTDACLEDATAPPCPDLGVSSVDHQVHLAWSGGDDPESGHWRTLLYRGEASQPGSERSLAELFASTDHFADGGFTAGTTHTYQVLAINGAFRSSESCPLLSYSTLRGDANGDGSLDPADVFYLIHHLLAGGPPPRGDADANGSGGVTVADVFYLVNYFYAGGPAPVWSGETRYLAAVSGSPVATATATDRALAGELSRDEPAPPASVLRIGKGTTTPGGTLALPVHLLDATGTPLGEERRSGARIQSLALQVVALPSSAVASIELRRAGATLRYEPLFESRPTTSSGAALVATFDEALAPLPILASNLAWGRPGPGILVAEVVVTLAEGIPAGGFVELRLDPAGTLLANQAGTLAESARNGWLTLVDGRLEVRP